MVNKSKRGLFAVVNSRTQLNSVFASNDEETITATKSLHYAAENSPAADSIAFSV